MKAGTKIAIGFTFITILGFSMGLAGLFFNWSINKKVDHAETAYIIKQKSLEAREYEKDYIIGRDENNLKKLTDKIDDINKVVSDELKTADNEIIEKELEKSLRTINEYKDCVSKLRTSQFDEITKKELETNAGALVSSADLILKEATREMAGAKNTSGTILWIFMGVCVFLAFLLGLYIIRDITGPLGDIIGVLSEASEQLFSASKQVSSASQSLAEGASEQASTIEQTSSSLEQMSSMTKKNADNSNQAKTYRNEVYNSLQTATKAMKETIEAMSRIKARGEEIGIIIKAIDEIAFQTNLLALNAAVEAARVGEAGAGFAVVANEVRNLAMRAAEAAKDTQGLIENTVSEIDNGSHLLEKTSAAFDTTKQHSKKVGELIDEISIASNEQALGIDQVNKAVIELDKVIQQNASNSEQSASASEQLNAQAEQMKNIVTQLTDLVGSNESGKDLVKKETRISGLDRNLLPDNGHPISYQPKRRTPPPQQVIPFEDDDLNEF